MPKSSSSSSSSSGSSSSSSSSGSSSSSSEDEHEQRKDEGQSRKRKLDPESSTDNKKASNNSDPPPISREAGAPAAGGVTVNTPGADKGGDKSDDDIGPQPAPTSEVSAEVGEADAEVAKEGRQDEIVMVPQKKKKVLEFENIYIDNLPSAEYYERSYMHRDVVVHLAVTKTDFVITASQDGHIKFWKKQELGIEFVKHFRSHLGNIQAIAVNSTGTLLVSISNDKSLKVFDVVNFDMINMMKLDYEPRTAEWIHRSGDAVTALAVSTMTTNEIYIYDSSQSTSTPIKVLSAIHRNPVTIIKYSAVHDVVISVDSTAMIEYWSSLKDDFEFPKRPSVSFDSKLDTDLFEFVQNKLTLLTLTISPNGGYFATLTSDRRVCLFKFSTGKLIRVFDEGLSVTIELQNSKQLIPAMEFGRRMATERELEKSDFMKFTNMLFDDTSSFLMYPTVLGVKIVNIVTNRLVKLIGKTENLRIIQIALFQGKPKKLTAAAPTIELETAENPTLVGSESDPTLFCTAFKKNRFYMFTKRDEDTNAESGTSRDVFNEKPSKEDIISATDDAVSQKVYENATIHTTKGDIQLKIFIKECPRSAENFCVHAKNGYYNGHIFHRVIKGFMIQTGDPTGVGTGGQSIWGHEFEDEFHPTLKHDRPYTLSMANAGPNTNGSQFFITLTPTPWLDNKHTVFGRVTRGMETVQNISLCKTNPKTDKPYDDVSIINISLR